jgi:hypothetical protein
MTIMTNDSTEPRVMRNDRAATGETQLGDFRPGDEAPRPNQRSGRWLKLLALLLAGALAVWWWMKWKSLSAPPAPAPTAAIAPAPAPAVAAPASPVVTAPAAPASAVETEPKTVATLASAADIRAALTDLLSAKTVTTWLQLDEFPRRVVGTVDNLARDHAALRLWPVFPTTGRFLVSDAQGRKTIHADNAKRYAPFVLVFEGIDNAAAASLYVGMLPILQRAYADLGFPQSRFHTRLLEVIDHLLAAPAPNEPVEVQLTQVRGEVPSTRPWVRFEFADPALESATAGHKIMLRMGAEHQRRVKVKLKALRAALVERAKI